MQGLQCRVLVQGGDVGFHVLRVANNRAQIEQVRAFWIDCIFRNSPRINILAGLQWIDGKKWLAFVIERRRDGSLKETIERQQVLCFRLGTGALVEFHQRAIRRECLRMALLFVELLKYSPDLDQLRYSLALTVGQFRKITR